MSQASAKTGGKHSHTHLPSEARYCGRCGGGLLPRQIEGRERPTCQECGAVHFREAKVAVTAAVIRDGALLLVKRRYPPEQGKWGLPGGYLDPGEDPAVAAAREALEETGLELANCRLLDVLFNPESGGADISIVYTGDPVGGELLAGDDAEEAAFFPLADLPEIAFASTQRVVKLLGHSEAETS